MEQAYGYAVSLLEKWQQRLSELAESRSTSSEDLEASADEMRADIETLYELEPADEEEEQSGEE